MVKTGLTREEACGKFWFVDIAGLVLKSRKDLAPHNKPYARDVPQIGFMDVIKIIKPHVLIGAAGAFTEEIIRLMADINRQPLIFALSNPTSSAECTAERAYRWSEGRAIFASGNPFAPVNFQGKTLRPGKAITFIFFQG